MQRTIKAFIWKGDQQYVAECHDLPVVTQGKTIEEAIQPRKAGSYGLKDPPWMAG